MGLFKGKKKGKIGKCRGAGLRGQSRGPCEPPWGGWNGGVFAGQSFFFSFSSFKFKKKKN